MKANEMWEQYCQKYPNKETYEAWSFGGDPDGLAQLVIDGVKTATCSLKLWYDLEEEPLPQVNEYSVILNSSQEAVCIIQTTKITICPYDEVTMEHAYKEGEDDRTLVSWRRIHEHFFTQELSESGLIFHEKLELVCEEFQVVYKGEE